MPEEIAGTIAEKTGEKLEKQNEYLFYLWLEGGRPTTEMTSLLQY